MPTAAAEAAAAAAGRSLFGEITFIARHFQVGVAASVCMCVCVCVHMKGLAAPTYREARLPRLASPDWAGLELKSP